jgi:hypothetical protein
MSITVHFFFFFRTIHEERRTTIGRHARLFVVVMKGFHSAHKAKFSHSNHSAALELVGFKIGYGARRMLSEKYGTFIHGRQGLQCNLFHLFGIF